MVLKMLSTPFPFKVHLVLEQKLDMSKTFNLMCVVHKLKIGSHVTNSSINAEKL